MRSNAGKTSIEQLCPQAVVADPVVDQVEAAGGQVRRSTHAHRPLRKDSDLGRAVAVFARTQQDSLWNRQQLSNQLCSPLSEYSPAALAGFELWRNGLCRPEAWELFKAASTPSRAARLTRTQLEAALKRVGRNQRLLVEDALGKQMRASCSSWKPPHRGR